MMDSHKKFVKDNVFVTVSHILIYAQNIILLPILIKHIGVSLYGAYALLITGIGFITGISSFGVGFRFKRFMPSTEDVSAKRDLFYHKLIFNIATISLISVFIMVFDSSIKTIVFKNDVQFSIYLVVFALIVSVIYNASTTFFRYTHRIMYFSIATTLRPYLMIGLVLLGIFIRKQKDLDFILSAYLLSMLVLAVPYTIKVIKEIGIGLSTFSIKGILEDIRLGFPLVLSYVLDFILSGSDRYIIALFMSTVDVGYYCPAYTLGSLIILFPKVFGVVLPPLLARAIDMGRDGEVKKIIDHSIKFFLILAIPFIAGSFILSKPILVILTNKQVANAGYLITPIVALGILFYGLILILSHILFVRLKTKIMFGVTVLAALGNLILNIVFIYIFRNILVAAITTFASYCFSFIVLNKKVNELLEIRYDFVAVGKCLFAAVLMTAFLYFTTRFASNALNMILIILLSSLVYFIGILSLRVVKVSELKTISGLIFCRK